MTNGPPTEDPAVPQEAQAFADVRGRPAALLSLCSALSLKHVVILRRELAGRKFDEIDLVIESGGGSVHAAYQIIELLRFHAEKVFACVPFYAKSAATLLCVGADTIFLDELAQLGPLDTQIYEEKKPGRPVQASALNPFKTLEELRRFAVESLDLGMKMIVERSGLPLDECLTHAMEFVQITTGPLFKQLDPDKLGECSRALSVAQEYASRLLRRFTAWDARKCEDISEQLVHGYPSHDYTIDYHELKEMGFDVALFKDEERPAVEGLISLGIKLMQQEKDAVFVVEPTVSIEEAPAAVENDDQAQVPPVAGGPQTRGVPGTAGIIAEEMSNEES